jgi:hypothetical protein
MRKLNCWEYTRCGKEHGAVDPRACCPVSTYASAHGVNQGESAGRLCWSIPGSHCRGQEGTDDPDGVPEACERCGFHALVLAEEGVSFQHREHVHSQAW